MVEVREGYKMTELGEIPSEWEVHTLADVVEKITDGAHKTPTYTEEGIPFLRVTDIQKNIIDWTKTKYISFQEHQELIKRCYPEKGDLLLSKNGTIGIVKTIDWEKEFSIFVSLCLIKINKMNSKINVEFLKYYLSSPMAQKQFKYASKQGTVTNLHLVEIKGCKIPILDLEEQQKIVEILSLIDTQIEQIEQMIEKIKELKKGLMQQLLTKGIGNMEFKQTELGTLPYNWDIKRIQDVTVAVDYRGKTPTKVSEGILLITAKNVKKGFIDFDTSKEYIAEKDYEVVMRRGKVKKGDILFTTEAPLGNVAMVEDTNIALAQRVIKFAGTAELNNEYLLHYMLSDIFQKILFEYSSGSTVKGIKGKTLMTLPVILPSLNEQQKIAEILSTIDLEIKNYEQEKVKYEELKKGLMQKLLTGKVRVKVD